MPVLDIKKIGSMALLKKTTSIQFPLCADTMRDIQNMIDTLSTFPFPLGIAANQLGIDKQIIVYKLEDNLPHVVINPSMDMASNDMRQAWEGCMSLPNMQMVTIRHKVIHMSGHNVNNELQEICAGGVLSILLQNSLDHLNNVTIFERNLNKKLISISSELNSLTMGLYQS